MENQNQKELLAYYNLAIKTCAATSKESFAKLIGANRTTVTLALNGDGKYATGKLVDRAKLKLMELGLIEPVKGMPVNIIKSSSEQSDVINNLLDKIREKDLEIKRLNNIINKLTDLESIKNRLSALEGERENVHSDASHTA